MKIAIDARIINSSTGRYIERLLHYLEKIDHQNTYLVLVRKKDQTYYKPHNKNFKIVVADFADYSFGEQLGFATFLQKLKPDLVHFCMPQQPLLYTGRAVTTVHDLNLLRITANDDMGPVELVVKKIIFRVLLFIVAHRTAQIIVPTKFTKRDLVAFSHINPKKVTVTYEGADKPSGTPQLLPALKNKDFIMYLGRAEPYKNNRGLITAHQQLLKKYPDLQLVIAGKIDILRQADMQWVGENGYKNIIFTNFVSDEQAAWLYANCRAYVFPSYMEGFGLPALEAMGCGAPIVSSNATCLPEVYHDAAHYFDPHSTKAMVAAISDVLENRELRNRLKQNGQKVFAKYSWQRMAEQTLEVYKSTLL